MNSNDDEEIYLNEDIDLDKLDIDPFWLMKKSDSEEHKEFVREQRKIQGITNKIINEETKKINANPSIYYDDKEKDSKALTSIEDNETIIVEEIENENETVLQQKMSMIEQRYALKLRQNQANSYAHHFDQTNRNKLKIQRSYETNISNYQSQISIDKYKADIQKEQLTEIEIQSRILLDQINEDRSHLRLWRYKDKYYCRVCEGIIVDNVECGLTIKEIEKKFIKPTKIVEIDNLITKKTQNITQSKLYQFILLNHIPIVSEIVFNPKENEFYEEDGVLYQNTFKYTKYLKRRLRLFSYGY